MPLSVSQPPVFIEGMNSEQQRLELKQLRQLERASLLEATTLLILVGVAVPLKHLAHFALPVMVMGPIHGLAFLIYLWVAVQTVSGGGWRPAEITRIILVAFVPVAGFFNVAYLRRRAKALAGSVARA